jgi:hypothetical protein
VKHAYYSLKGFRPYPHSFEGLGLRLESFEGRDREPASQPFKYHQKTTRLNLANQSPTKLLKFNLERKWKDHKKKNYFFQVAFLRII